MLGNNIGNPIGGIIPVGGANAAKAVTANMTWGASVGKAVGKNVSPNYDWAVFVGKAVSFSVASALIWAGLAAKDVGKSVSTSFSWLAARIVKDAGKVVTANLSWAVTIQGLIQNILDTDVLTKPVNCVLAGQEKIKSLMREWEIPTKRTQAKAGVFRSGTVSLKNAKPSFTTKTGSLR